MKTKTKNNSATKLLRDSPDGTLAAHDEIALAAYGIWEQEGHPQGRDVDNWLRAEGLLRDSRRPAPVQS
jgi:hypothetical protein